MIDVEFDEPKNILDVRPGRTTSPLIRLVMKTGLAGSEGQAKLVLVIISLLLFAGAGWYYYEENIAEARQETVYYEDIPEELRVQIPPRKLQEIPRRN